MANLLLSIEKFGLGLDYLVRYPGYIESLTREDLLAAARQYLDENRLVIGVAGPESFTLERNADA